MTSRNRNVKDALILILLAFVFGLILGFLELMGLQSPVIPILLGIGFLILALLLAKVIDEGWIWIGFAMGIIGAIGRYAMGALFFERFLNAQNGFNRWFDFTSSWNDGLAYFIHGPIEGIGWGVLIVILASRINRIFASNS